MIQCNGCGTSNHTDSRYCGTCGDALSVPGGIASLVADDPKPVDRAAGVEPLGVDDAASTHRVNPPAFGETGPAATSAVTSPSPPPTAPFVASSDAAARSTSIMIVAVAAAAVVIAGGAFILFVAGSGDDETAVVDEASTETVEPATNEAAVTAATVPAETPPAEVSSPDTAAPQTTAPPTAETTLPPQPTRGPGDLGLTQPILNETCDGRYITFVGSAIGDRPYSVVVGELLDRYPGANYVWTKACPSLRQEFSDGADIYGVVFGPYATQQEACDARAFGPEDAYVRRISTSDPEDHTVSC